jgi:glycosyltransferase involved in cell wall biosynthesis
VARRKYDVVIEDGWAHPTTLLFNIACWITGGVRLVIIVHQVRWRTMNPVVRSIVRVVEQIALRPAHLILAVSNFISGEVERLIGSSERVAVAPPGSTPVLNTIRDRGNTDGTPLRLLFVGNCNRLKGLDYLIEALGSLQDVPLVLDVVGDETFEPRYYRRLVRQSRAPGVSGRVVFHGAKSHEELAYFYSRADIFTFPSLYEGFGIVLAEAMHAGLPIVATRIGPTDEILREGENALIVAVSDSAALAGAIRRLAGDVLMRESFGRRSRELADSLPTWQQTCDNVCHRIEIMSRTFPDKTQMT